MSQPPIADLDASSIFTTPASIQSALDAANNLALPGLDAIKLSDVLTPDGRIRENVLALHRVFKNISQGRIYSTHNVLNGSQPVPGHAAGELSLFRHSMQVRAGAPGQPGNLSWGIDDNGVAGPNAPHDPPFVVGSNTANYTNGVCSWLSKLWLFLFTTPEFRAFVEGVTGIFLSSDEWDDVVNRSILTASPNHQTLDRPAAFSHHHFVHSNEAQRRASNLKASDDEKHDDIHPVVRAAHKQETKAGRLLNLVLNPCPPQFFAYENGSMRQLKIETVLGPDFIEARDIAICVFLPLLRRKHHQYELVVELVDVIIVGKATIFLPPPIEAPSTPKKRSRYGASETEDSSPTKKKKEDDDDGAGGASTSAPKRASTRKGLKA